MAGENRGDAGVSSSTSAWTQCGSRAGLDPGEVEDAVEVREVVGVAVDQLEALALLGVQAVGGEGVLDRAGDEGLRRASSWLTFAKVRLGDVVSASASARSRSSPGGGDR